MGGGGRAPPPHPLRRRARPDFGPVHRRRPEPVGGRGLHFVRRESVHPAAAALPAGPGRGGKTGRRGPAPPRRPPERGLLRALRLPRRPFPRRPARVAFPPAPGAGGGRALAAPRPLLLVRRGRSALRSPHDPRAPADRGLPRPRREAPARRRGLVRLARVADPIHRRRRPGDRRPRAPLPPRRRRPDPAEDPGRPFRRLGGGPADGPVDPAQLPRRGRPDRPDPVVRGAVPAGAGPPGNRRRAGPVDLDRGRNPPGVRARVLRPGGPGLGLPPPGGPPDPPSGFRRPPRPPGGVAGRGGGPAPPARPRRRGGGGGQTRRVRPRCSAASSPCT